MFRTINIALIWVCWFVQTFLMLIVMLNFLIAVITDNYGRVQQQQRVYGFMHKAQLNHETYMLLSVLQDLPEYRCLVFQKDRGNEAGEDEMDRRFEDLKKFIDKRTRTLCSNHESIEKNLSEVFRNQHDLTETMNNKFTQVAQQQ